MDVDGEYAGLRPTESQCKRPDVIVQNPMMFGANHDSNAAGTPQRRVGGFHPTRRHCVDKLPAWSRFI